MSRLVVVTASTNLERARPCIESWGTVPLVCVANGGTLPAEGTSPDQSTLLIHQEYLGTVAAFQAGVNFVLDHLPETEIIACLHDDVLLQDSSWLDQVLRRFDQQPTIGLLGFGGAVGLGAADLYQTPYAPMQLARIGFRSNLMDAEVHGIRSLLPERVACLDGFSQLGRREFWRGEYLDLQGKPYEPYELQRPWDVLDGLGVVHHGYDGMLGCLAARGSWETWYLPIRCRHLGGQTAVGDAGYQRWATTHTAGGDHGFWEQAHAVWYDHFRDVLPLRV